MITNHEIQGILLRTKASWVQEAGHNTKYFLRLERNAAKNKVMSAVRSEDGKISRDTQVVVKHQRDFYANLYSKDEMVHFLTKSNCPTPLGEEKKRALDSPITKVELAKALKETKCNKAPGPDGLPADFYKFFWKQLGDVIFEALTDSLSKSKLFESARNGIISLIPKKDRDPLLLQNWWAICLLNADYKMLAKALASRLKAILPGIINEDQTSFIPSRNISHNI